MSDMKLYKILETFDKLESANDKLTPYVAEDGDAEGAAERIRARVAARSGEDEVQETNTQVQTMGNKVKVTTDGDTTEFDDTETAAAMMGSKDDENQFATEAVSDDDGDWAYDNKKDKDLDDKADEEDEKEEKQLDEWAPEVSQDQDWDDIDDDDDDDDDTEEVTEEVVDEASEDDAEEVTEEAFGHIDDFDRSQGGDQGTEFSTFDSENEAHRKRLQRGTPVVLSPEICSDAAGNRRGVFVNRSTSGHFGTVIRDCDGQTVKVHLSDIVSADITNNSVYEQYNIDFDAMLAEDITMTQTTNLEQPENDTTTVTAVGPDAGEELAAMMANAGLADAGQVDAGPVDQGEAEPAQEPGMQDMMNIVGEPAVQEDEGWEDDGFDDMSLSATGPTDADLDHIESEPDLEKELSEDDIQSLDQDLGLAIANGHDIYDVMTSLETPQKDREILQREYDEIYNELQNSEFAQSNHPDDDFEAYELTAFETLASRIHDMYSSNKDDGGMFGKNPLDDFPDLNITTEEGAEGAVEPSNEDPRLSALISGIAQIEKPSEARSLEVEEEAQAAQAATAASCDRVHDRVEARKGEGKGRIHARVEERETDIAGGEEELMAERDIEHANTPDERTAGADMVTHGTSGGLNRDKNMFRKEYPGDNPMAVTEEGSDMGREVASTYYQQHGDQISILNYLASAAGIDRSNLIFDDADLVYGGQTVVPGALVGNLTLDQLADELKQVAVTEDTEDFKFVNEHEDVDNFLSLYKEFSIRGEKK